MGEGRKVNGGEEREEERGKGREMEERRWESERWERKGERRDVKGEVGYT